MENKHWDWEWELGIDLDGGWSPMDDLNLDPATARMIDKDKRENLRNDKIKVTEMIRKTLKRSWILDAGPLSVASLIHNSEQRRQAGRAESLAIFTVISRWLLWRRVM